MTGEVPLEQDASEHASVRNRRLAAQNINRKIELLRSSIERVRLLEPSLAILELDKLPNTVRQFNLWSFDDLTAEQPHIKENAPQTLRKDKIASLSVANLLEALNGIRRSLTKSKPKIEKLADLRRRLQLTERFRGIAENEAIKLLRKVRELETELIDLKSRFASNSREMSDRIELLEQENKQLRETKKKSGTLTPIRRT